MALPNLPFLVLDTETTGFVPRVHRVIEFACIQVVSGVKEREFEQLFSLPPGTEIPPPIRVLTRIRTEDLANRPTFKEMLPTLQAFLTPETIIVGQNIPFDIGMLRSEGFDLTDQPWIDTSMLASIVFPELESFSLGFMSEVLPLSHEPKHRALGDVRATLELLTKCIERFLSLPEATLERLRMIAARGPKGYRRFFEALPRSRARSMPAWSVRSHRADAPSTISKTPLPIPAQGTVQLLEDALDPQRLTSILAGARDGTWIAVKNVRAARRRLAIPEGVFVLEPPEHSLDPAKRAALLSAETLTADECTLAIKLSMNDILTKDDCSLHGGESHVWKAKLACDGESPVQRERINQALRGRAIISHQYLLELLQSGDGALSPDLHIIVDDASMLEDTATAAFGWTCHLPSLRAAAEGRKDFMQLVDVVELWMERLRSGTTLRYITAADLSELSSVDLRSTVERVLAGQVPGGLRRPLEDLLCMLDSANVRGRIIWIETMADHSKTMKSVPDDVALHLSDTLFSSVRTTLIVPPERCGSLQSILAPRVQVTQLSLPSAPPAISVDMPSGSTFETVLTSHASGHLMLVVPSKRVLEDIFVRFAEPLEAKGVMLLCQGFSGGQGRMQAEFSAAKSPAILCVTPWLYEGLDLPRMVDRLVILTLPFDHPSHAVVSRRALRYSDPFREYSLVRLRHRLFRMLRVFAAHASERGHVDVLDERLRTKPYGTSVAADLLSFTAQPGVPERPEQMRLL